MTGFVVDASVALKWYLPEPHEEHAAGMRQGAVALDAPDLLHAEVGNALWKRVRRSQLRPEEASRIVEALALMPIEVHPSRLLAGAALQIARATELTVYDSLYLATSLLTERPLVTADRRLFDTARRVGQLRQRILWIEEIPARPE